MSQVQVLDATKAQVTIKAMVDSGYTNKHLVCVGEYSEDDLSEQLGLDSTALLENGYITKGKERSVRKVPHTEMVVTPAGAEWAELQTYKNE